jgi:hypothetical protein
LPEPRRRRGRGLATVQDAVHDELGEVLAWPPALVEAIGWQLSSFTCRCRWPWERRMAAPTEASADQDVESSRVKISFRTGNGDRTLGRLNYCLLMVEACAFTPEDLWSPQAHGRKSIKIRTLKRAKAPDGGSQLAAATCVGVFLDHSSVPCHGCPAGTNPPRYFARDRAQYTRPTRRVSRDRRCRRPIPWP